MTKFVITWLTGVRTSGSKVRLRTRDPESKCEPVMVTGCVVIEMPSGAYFQSSMDRCSEDQSIWNIMENNKIGCILYVIAILIVISGFLQCLEQRSLMNQPNHLMLVEMAVKFEAAIAFKFCTSYFVSAISICFACNSNLFGYLLQQFIIKAVGLGLEWRRTQTVEDESG